MRIAAQKKRGHSYQFLDIQFELSSLRSRPPRLSESDGGQAQSASGPEGIMECWNIGFRLYLVEKYHDS